MQNNRVYRFLRTSMTIIAGVLRYLLLMGRRRLPWGKPSPAAWSRAHRKTGEAIYRLATTLRGVKMLPGSIVQRPGLVSRWTDTPPAWRSQWITLMNRTGTGGASLARILGPGAL